jgi:large subunit ribosomal protein L18
MKPKLKNEKQRRRARRAMRIRRTIEGTSERPRLAVYRSAKHIYAQLVDDLNGQTLFAASSLTPAVREAVKDKNKCDVSTAVGKRLAEIAKEKGIQKVVFDRAGFPYHGRIKALAEGAREAGLEF